MGRYDAARIGKESPKKRYQRQVRTSIQLPVSVTAKTETASALDNSAMSIR